MSKLKNTEKFLSYISNPLTRTSIELLYNSNYIMFEKCDLYRDFVLSLSDLIFTTYMGDKITKEEERINHFKWCWDRTVKNFEMENIYFGDNQELYDYFTNFMVEIFYSVEDKSNNEKINHNVIKLWEYIFNYRIIKTRSDVDTFIEVYKMFEKSLKNGKKLDF